MRVNFSENSIIFKKKWKKAQITLRKFAIYYETAKLALSMVYVKPL